MYSRVDDSVQLLMGSGDVVTWSDSGFVYFSVV